MGDGSSMSMELGLPSLAITNAAIRLPCLASGPYIHHARLATIRFANYVRWPTMIGSSLLLSLLLLLLSAASSSAVLMFGSVRWTMFGSVRWTMYLLSAVRMLGNVHTADDVSNALSPARTSVSIPEQIPVHT
ncbi:hypothetical protein BZA05DRAFT_403991 [Tricharina praecox]|uniref:uncharacterized protein n=1 Tax=Tricharina praecox TaxID=43433 RepID=UPI00221F04A2|nr:uncharacterized protein BZA05DRAFT_403991 [Tricharina praecox]KAI5848402.1 hypothetical protein BZA05DRAFT_403991 [Tricharina praecox]